MDQEIKDLISSGCQKAEEFLLNGRPEEARMIADQVLKVDPGCYEAKLVFGLCLPDAKNYLLKLAEDCPNDFRAYNNLGLVSSRSGDSNEAIYYFREATKRTSDPGPAINLSLELNKSGDATAAEEMLSHLSSKSAIAKFNYAGFLHSERRLEEAERVYREVDSPLAKRNLAEICLLTGRFEEGYELLESRWEAFPHLAHIRSQLKSPFWDGSVGKKIVLFCEQGLGDYIHFARYANKVKEISSEVYLDVGPNLREAFSETGVKFYEGQSVDACCSVVSLPNLLKCAVPEPIKIKSSDISFEKYNEFLKIGLCWCGSPSHPDDISRSIFLREFESMSRIEGLKWFTCGWSYGNQVKGGRIVNWEDGSENVKIVDTGAVQVDVAKTAGIISSMDLVITVDTATAHIAGSLGKKNWLLLPYNSEWRWGLTDRTEWYPSVRIFRQHRSGDWGRLLSNLHYNLARNELN